MNAAWSMLPSLITGTESQWLDAPALLPALSVQPKGTFTLSKLQPDSTYYVRAHLRLPAQDEGGAWTWKPLTDEAGVCFTTITSAAVQARQAAGSAKVAASQARAEARLAHSAQERRNSAVVQARAQSAAAAPDAVATQSVHALQEARALCRPGSIAERQARLMGSGGSTSKPSAAATSSGGAGSDTAAQLDAVHQLKQQLARAQAQLGQAQAQLDHSAAQPAAMEAKLQQLAARERELRIQLDDFSTPESWGALEAQLREEGFQRGDVRLVLSLFEGHDAAFKRRLLQRIDELVQRTGMPRMYVREAAAVYELRVNGSQDVSVQAVLQGAQVPAALQGATAEASAGDDTEPIVAFIAAWVQVHYPDAASK